MGVWLVRVFQFNPSHPKGKIMMTEKTQIARWVMVALDLQLQLGLRQPQRRPA